jgi:hypothetical protein
MWAMDTLIDTIFTMAVMGQKGYNKGIGEKMGNIGLQ